MENKITRKRLSDMFAYEWIMIAAVILAAIFLLELFYSLFSVKLTTGQQFRIFYDTKIIDSSEDLVYLLEKKNTFSFDVLDLATETVDSTGNVLSARDVLGMGDVIITDAEKDEEDETAFTRAENIAMGLTMYTMDELLADAEEYLDSLKAAPDGGYSYEELDHSLIERGFNERLGKDNRFRTAEQKTEGLALEEERIEKLTRNYADFKKLLELDDQLVAAGEEGIFYRSKLNGETEERYGLRAAELTNGKEAASKFFSIDKYGENYEIIISSENVIIMFFDRYEDSNNYEYKGKGALQFELLSFISVVVRECSDLLS